MYGTGPLYDAIVDKARIMTMAGATVISGMRGYGPKSREVQYFQRTTEARPIIIEIVDTKDKIDGFVPALEGMLDGGVISIENISFCEPERPR